MSSESGQLNMDARILRDMSQGILTVAMDGTVLSVNGTAEKILGKRREDLIGHLFTDCFNEHVEDDAFNRTVLNALRGYLASTENIVPYYLETETKLLNAMTSYLYDGEEVAGVIVVLNDVTVFGRLLSRDVLRELYGSPDGAALGGRKETVSVLMSDLRGFTAISERMDPKSLLHMVNHYLAEMTAVLEECRGTVIEIIGDGILALFGAPLSTERHADHAVTAALRMQQAMASVNRWNSANGYPELKMGIGINSGEAIVGNIGSELRAKYGALGPTVNLAGRIEGRSMPGEVLISEYTREYVVSDLRTENETEIYPKGVDAPVRIMRVTGIGFLDSDSFRASQEVLTELERPAFLLFSRVVDKQVVPETLTGTVTAVSASGCILETGAELSERDDLKLDFGGGIYAKAAFGGGTGKWHLVFTSPADAFLDWIERSQKA